MTQSSRSLPPCSFPAAELFNAPAWAGFTTSSSRKQCRSQPALRGFFLCCAGQRQRHAEHYGRLLLHGGRPAGHLLLVSSGVSNPSTVKSREASALSALPRRAASRPEGRCYLGGLQPPRWRRLCLQAQRPAPRRALATLVSTSSGVILAAMSTSVLRPQLRPPWPAWRCGRGDGTFRSRPLGGHHALQHVEGRLVCLVVGCTHGDPELAAGSGGSERRLSRWHSARAFLRRAAATRFWIFYVVGCPEVSGRQYERLQVRNVAEGKGEVRRAVETSGQNKVPQAFRDPAFSQDVL